MDQRRSEANSFTAGEEILSLLRNLKIFRKSPPLDISKTRFNIIIQSAPCIRSHFFPSCFPTNILYSGYMCMSNFTKQTYFEGIFRESDLGFQTLGNKGEMGGRIRGTVQCWGVGVSSAATLGGKLQME
jgi:hypothetical protein